MSLCILYMFWILKINLWYPPYPWVPILTVKCSHLCLFVYLVFPIKIRHVSIYCSGHPCAFSSAGNLGLFKLIRASPPVLNRVCDPAKVFLTSEFSYLLFRNPTHKTETRTANRWELLIEDHLHQSLCSANQKQGGAVR
jgi:hypothetical protein